MPTTYPIPVFHFQVEWEGTRVGFTEATGFKRTIQPIEYREGNSPEYFVTKMPGMEKFDNVTLKRGTVPGDGEFFAWINTVALNQIERRTIIVTLLDETHSPVFTWTLFNAWPCSATYADLKSTGNEVAIESLEICYEKMVQTQ
jgi:phage tail-like protein